MNQFIKRAAIFNLVVFLLLACSKKDEFDFNQHNKVAVITRLTDDVSKNGATLHGRVNTKNGSQLQEIGFLYGINSTLSNGIKLKISSSLDTGEFMLKIAELTPSTVYYYKAYATNKNGVAYGDISSFTTERGYLPVSKTLDAEQIGRTFATVKGMVKDSGGYTIKRRGICYSSTNTMPTVLMSYQNSNDADSTYSVNLTNLNAGTNYYIRSFIETSFGVGYGDVLTFKTLAPVVASGVSTNRPSNITMNAATVGGNVVNDEGSPISKRGIVYSSTTTSPSLENAFSINLGSGIGVFSGTITDLNVNTTYYVRAYSTNAAGTSYGSVETFRTLLPSLPTSLTTYTASSISKNSAYLSGYVGNSGGGTIQSKGIVYSANTSSPTINNGAILSGGSGTGSIGSTVYNLSSNTTYYARTFATNEAGTAYGAVISFTTSPSYSAPTDVSTYSASNISTNTVTLNGYVGGNGNSTITEKGFVYSAYYSTPTLSNATKSYTTLSTVGSFSLSASGLSKNTYYYVRAYATNAYGTTYGSVISLYTN
ncbi:hypothetical protein [Sphingobacterium sp. BN32]|uniref:hypothetical protein n=1 Tax=Sphingobacterium sp. BN32 TaxID=3058432 RepID=UPI00265D1AAA|nr:hypothetical protein [Sphingobacterium sp. BN32]WKK60375.1 hypothetical protein QYC40_09050 [Sphingobacterium sp. BN32]